METQQVLSDKYFSDITAKLLSHQKLIDNFVLEHSEALKKSEIETEAMESEQIGLNRVSKLSFLFQFGGLLLIH